MRKIFLYAAMMTAAVFNANAQVQTGAEAQTNDYLHFVALNDGDTVRLDKKGTPDAINLQYSKDKKSWTDYTWTETTGASIALDKNDTVWFRAGGTGKNATFSQSASTYYNFVFGTNDSIAAGGNIMSLYDATLEQDTMTNFGFRSLFNKCSALVSAPELPATQLAEQCYAYIFSGCSSLTAAPALPVTTMAEGCYNNMFKGCSSLTTAPALPATTMAKNCYQGMFRGCSALTAAPALNANTLAVLCYSYMFDGCSSLNVDTLGTSCNGVVMSFPATGANNWNGMMFNGCHGACTNVQLGGKYCVSEYIPRQVTVSVNDTAMGSVTGAGTYQDGTTATLTATANEGYQFVQWSNGETANPYSFVVTSDTTLTATFEIPGTAIEEVAGDRLHVAGAKFMRDGKLYLRRGEVIYDAKGARVE